MLSCLHTDRQRQREREKDRCITRSVIGGNNRPYHWRTSNASEPACMIPDRAHRIQSFLCKQTTAYNL